MYMCVWFSWIVGLAGEVPIVVIVVVVALLNLHSHHHFHMDRLDWHLSANVSMVISSFGHGNLNLHCNPMNWLESHFGSDAKPHHAQYPYDHERNTLFYQLKHHKLQRGREWKRRKRTLKFDRYFRAIGILPSKKKQINKTHTDKSPSATTSINVSLTSCLLRWEFRSN